MQTAKSTDRYGNRVEKNHIIFVYSRIKLYQK
jgi:hypothetical protein